MIAVLALASLLSGAVLSLAALAMERAATALSLARRGIWIAAMLATVVLGVLPATPLVLRAPVPDAAGSSASAWLPASFATAQRGAGDRAERVRRALGSLDRPLLALWACASALSALTLVAGARRLRRARRDWMPSRLHGVDVLVAPGGFGPAVVGIARPTIVVPQWLHALDRRERILALRHELEHVRGHDVALILAAAVLVALAPWHLALLWQQRRLRAAVELDCDRRVLRRVRDPRQYGRLLLAVAARRSAHAVAQARLAPSLHEPATLLARRIDAMRTPLSFRAPRTAAAMVAIAAVTTALACELPRVAAPRPATTAGASPTQERPYLESQVDQPVTPLVAVPPQYPTMLRRAGVQGVVLTSFVVDANGRVEPASLQVLRSDHGEFTDAARTAVLASTFTPARVAGRAVRQLVQQPYVFNIAR